jgi:hypothetical protein
MRVAAGTEAVHQDGEVTLLRPDVSPLLMPL